MKKLKLALGLLFVILSALSLSAAAQGQIRDNRREPDRVCVYENNYYGGWEQCFAPGEQIGDLGNHRKKISSIRVYGDARVAIFTDKEFKGASMEVTSDLADLAQQKVPGAPFGATWNDQVESLQVTTSRATARDSRDNRRDDYRDDRDSRNDRYDRDRDERPVAPPRNGICVFAEKDYKGRSECFESGNELADLGRGGWNDHISSIQVFGPTRVTLYRDINFRGDRITIDRNVPDLRQLHMTGSLNWNNQVSSIDISGGRGYAYGRNNRR